MKSQKSKVKSQKYTMLLRFSAGGAIAQKLGKYSNYFPIKIPRTNSSVATIAPPLLRGAGGDRRGIMVDHPSLIRAKTAAYFLFKTL